METREEGTALKIAWFREGGFDSEGITVGIMNRREQIAVGVSDEFPYRGLLLLFPEDHKALLLQDEALNAVLGEIDMLLHGMIDSGSTEEADVEGASAAEKKVSLPN